MKNRTFHLAAMELLDCIKCIDMQTWLPKMKFVNFCVLCVQCVYVPYSVHCVHTHIGCIQFGMCIVQCTHLKMRIVALNGELLTVFIEQTGWINMCTVDVINCSVVSIRQKKRILH